jgi:hypothetical protein
MRDQMSETECILDRHELYPRVRRSPCICNRRRCKTLERLRFLRVAFESGPRLDELTRLCRALDAGDSKCVHGCVEQLRRKIDVRRKELMVIETSLGELASSA